MMKLDQQYAGNLTALASAFTAWSLPPFAEAEWHHSLAKARAEIEEVEGAVFEECPSTAL